MGLHFQRKKKSTSEMANLVRQHANICRIPIETFPFVVCVNSITQCFLLRARRLTSDYVEEQQTKQRFIWKCRLIIPVLSNDFTSIYSKSIWVCLFSSFIDFVCLFYPFFYSCFYYLIYDSLQKNVDGESRIINLILAIQNLQYTSINKLY